MRRSETAPRPRTMKFGTITKQHLFALLDANSDFNRGEIATRESERECRTVFAEARRDGVFDRLSRIY